MDLYSAFILAIVEGLTEFLPISSTGHMIVVSKFLGIEQTSMVKAFEVIIQLASIFAIFIIYNKRFNLKNRDLWIKTIVAFLPLAIIGFIFKDEIKKLFDVYTVAIMFIIGGVVFLILENFYKLKNNTKSLDKITYKQALIIGLFQVFALIPGTSRAGASIVGALIVGLDRKTSAEFSFLLALPVMGAVSGYDILKHHNEFLNQNFLILAVGFIVAFIVAFISVKLFMKFLERFTFNFFGIYRIIFGIYLLFFIKGL